MSSPRPAIHARDRGAVLALRARWVAALLLGTPTFGCGAAAPPPATAPREPTAPMLGPYASLDAYCADEGLSADEEEGGLGSNDDVVLACAPLRAVETASGTGSIVRAGVVRLTELGADHCRVFVDVLGGRTWLADASLVCETRDLDPERTLTMVAHAETVVEESSVTVTIDLGGDRPGSHRATCRRDGPEWRCTAWLPVPAADPAVATTSP